MNLIFICHMAPDVNDQRYLLEAAERAGAKAAWVHWSKEYRIVIGNQVKATFPKGTPVRKVADALYAMTGREKAIVIDGMTTKLNRASFLFPKPTRDSIRILGVYDDYRYDTKGLRRLKFYVVDGLLRLRSKYSWVFSPGLMPRYPDAFLIDNASYLTPLPAVDSADPSRILYVGSIDIRCNVTLLADVARQNPSLQFDVYGLLRPDAKAEFDHMVAESKNVNFLGAWDENDFPAILSRYRIGFIPYRAPHHMTDYIQSSKMYHYLNAGLEVIATPIPHAVRQKDYLHLINSAEEWPKAYHEALARPRAKGWPYRDYLWDVRWRQLLQAVESREARN